MQCDKLSQVTPGLTSVPCQTVTQLNLLAKKPLPSLFLLEHFITAPGKVTEDTMISSYKIVQKCIYHKLSLLLNT